MTVMAAGYLDNSQRSRGSISQAPPSPSPYFYSQNASNMNVIGGMSAPPTPVGTPTPPLSMYRRHSAVDPSTNGMNAGSNHGSNHRRSMNPGSNHGSLNGSLHGGSSHASPGVQNGAPRRVIMQQPRKAASAMNITTPFANKPSGRRHSLVGFDPMLADSTVPTTPAQKRTSAMYEFASAPTLRKSVSSKPGESTPPAAPFSFNGSNHNPRPVTPPQAPDPVKRGSLTPKERPSKAMASKAHRKNESFCVSDLRSISQEAMDDETNDVREAPEAAQGSQATRRQSSPKSSESQRRQSSPKTSRIFSPLASPKGNVKAKINKKDGRAPTPKKENNSPNQSPNGSKGVEKNETTTHSPPRLRKLSFLKKGHRRTRSLESQEEILPKAQKGAEVPSKRSSLPNTPASERKPSMYPAVVQDLMELKFNNLQIPSLAKPSPTSFLTGKEDELKRTCELEPAPHQMEIPALPEFVVVARLNEFVENYRRVDQNFDLQQWVGKNRMDLRQTKIPQHLPIAQSLMECGDDVCLQGFITKGTIADDRLECVVFEGQRQFMAVFRGTTEQQNKLNTKTKKKTCPLDQEHPDVEVYQCFHEEYVKLEAECFALLDRLTEENPFCDVVFSGHSFGAAMATIAAFRYSNARPMMRVSCLTLASPKVGFSIFRNMINSQPNLKVMRLEYGQDGKCQLPGTGGSHVGHTLVLHGSLGHNSLKTSQPVLAYKFEVPKFKKFKTTHPDLRSYVTALEELARLNLPWAQDFVGTSGQGVVVGNEARRVV